MSVRSIVIKAIAGCAAVAVLLGAIFILTRPEAEPEKETVVVYSSDEEDIVRVDIEKEGGFSVEKTANGEWSMRGMAGIGVNNAFAAALVKSLANIEAAMLVEENAENAALYGLDSPTVKARLYYADGEEEILIGKPSGEYYYLSVKSENDVYIVAKNDLYMVFLDKIKYLDDTVLEIEVDTLDRITYNGIKLQKRDGDWYMTAPYSRLADANAVKGKILEQLRKITATQILEKDSVDLKGGTVVNLYHEDSKRITFTVFEGGYILKDGSDYVYKAEGIDFIKLTGFEIMSKYIAPISITEVSEIKLVAPGKTTLLTIEAPSSEAPVFYKDGKEADEESFRSFYRILMGLTLKAEGSGTGAAEYAIIFTKENGDVYDMRFVEADENEYAISINGKTEFTIAKKAVTDIFGYLKDIDVF